VRPFDAPVGWALGTGGTMLVVLMLLMLLLGIYPTPFISIVQAAGLGVHSEAPAVGMP
jgi:NADH-quinone oxidoreductase subunit N